VTDPATEFAIGLFLAWSLGFGSGLVIQSLKKFFDQIG